MSLLSLPRTYESLARLRQIAGVLARHGFGHLLGKLNLDSFLPGWRRLKHFSHMAEDMPPQTAAERLTSVMQELGATFIKLGQLLATRPDLIPVEYVEAFSALQDQVEPIAAERIHAVIQTHLGSPVSTLFKTFEDAPIASGSIGQAHGAILHDGTEVIVKVKRPDTDRRVRQDLSLLTWLADAAETHLSELKAYHPRILCEEFAETMRRELDFSAEASFTAKMAEECRPLAAVAVPVVYWEFATHDTLVMQRFRGTPLLAYIRTADMPRRKELARIFAQAFMHQYFTSGLFHADPHPGNILILEDGRLGLIDYGQTGRLSRELRRQLAIAVVAMSGSDADTLTDILADLGVLSEGADARSFRSQLALLLDRYFGVPLNRVDIARAFEDILSVARVHGIQLPRDFVLLGKSLVTATSVTRLLDPEFRLDEAAKPETLRLLKAQFDPKSLLRDSAFSLYQLATFLRRAPEDLRDLLQKARSGNFRVIFHHEALESLGSEIDSATNRISLALVLAAIVIGSSLILSNQSVMPQVGHVSLGVILATGGFAMATLMGLYLIWSILRSGKL